MSIKISPYTSNAGEVFDSAESSAVMALINKATGGNYAKVVFMNNGTALLFKPLPPKSKGKAQDAKASKGAAGPVTSLVELQAQMAQMMALLAAQQGRTTTPVRTEDKPQRKPKVA